MLAVGGVFGLAATANQDSDGLGITSMMAAAFGAMGTGLTALGIRDHIKARRQQANVGQNAARPQTPIAVAVLPATPHRSDAV